MPLPQPEGWETRFLALERAVKDLRTSITTAAGSTSASKGWRLGGEAPEPDELNPGEVHIRGEGNSLVVRSQDGDVTLGTPEFGPAVDDPVVDLFNAPAEYTPAQIQTYTDSLQSLADSYVQLVDVLRSGQFPS